MRINVSQLDVSDDKIIDQEPFLAKTSTFMRKEERVLKYLKMTTSTAVKASKQLRVGGAGS